MNAEVFLFQHDMHRLLELHAEVPGNMLGKKSGKRAGAARAPLYTRSILLSVQLYISDTPDDLASVDQLVELIIFKDTSDVGTGYPGVSSDQESVIFS